MGAVTDFDPTFDFRHDSNNRDPDKASATLRSYHKLLWSKNLPSGRPFELSDHLRGAYLHHASDLGEFYLASDTSVPSWSRFNDRGSPVWSYRWKQAVDVIRPQDKAQHDQFNTVAYQMGAMMLFPARQVDGKWTINQARGCTPSIADRLDLTVECIRRYYLDPQDEQSSPLAPTFKRYTEYFDLFESFDGYVRFFLLHDIVSANRSAVDFLLPFSDFESSAFPADSEQYSAYCENAARFISARNRRMTASVT